MPEEPVAAGLVRLAGSADLADVAALHREHLRFHAELDPRYRQLADRDLVALHRQYLRDQTVGVLVVELEHRLAGFAICRLEHAALADSGSWLARLGGGMCRAEFGTLVDCYVAAACRRRGLGRRLVAAAMAWFEERGVTEVDLGVAAGNITALAFWQALGFEVYRHKLRRPL